MKPTEHYEPNKATDQDNFVLLLREAAKACPDVLLRKIATERADELVFSLAQVTQRKSIDSVRRLNVAVIRAYNAFNKCVWASPPPPSSGAGEVREAA